MGWPAPLLLSLFVAMFVLAEREAWMRCRWMLVTGDAPANKPHAKKDGTKKAPAPIDEPDEDEAPEE